jgi:quercetin dioxygenase-like cupin family protein
MIWDELRRIVTENGKDGRSSVKIDDRAAKVLAVDEAGLAEIWTAALRKGLLAGDDRLKSEDVRLEPDAGALKVRWFSVSPENEKLSRAETEAQAAFAFAACGAAHARVDASRHPMMHRTETLDVIVLVRGNVDLLLDDGEAKALKPGDVVVQRATNHAWVNRGTETALLVAVLINAHGN